MPSYVEALVAQRVYTENCIDPLCSRSIVVASPPVQQGLCLAIMGVGTEQQVAAEALAALRAAYDEAVASIQAIPDSRQEFQEATELARVLGEWSKQAGRLRAEVAVRIAEAEQLSLAGLANRLSVSRSRAQQWMESGRTGSKEGDGDG